MKHFDYLLRRLRALEPAPARITPWPPEPHTFAYQLWLACGKPEERRSYWQMYGECAKQFWSDYREM